MLPTIPGGLEVQVRFRDEPTDDDIRLVREYVAPLQMGHVIDEPRFIIHAVAAGPELSPIGQDEKDRPIFGNAVGQIVGETRSVVCVRVPYTDARAQQVIDTEASQLPKEGPGLICILTHHEKYWKSLIERSFNPTIRRRISGVLLFETGITLGTHGIEMQTAGRLLMNPHARTPLPPWLVESINRLPVAIRIC